MAKTKQEEGLTVSISKIKTYKQCPRKYYYTYIKKLPLKDWAHFDLGTFVHGVLEHFHNSFKEDCSDMNLKRLMKESFKKQRDLMDAKKPLTKEVLDEAKELLSLYLKNIEDKGIGSQILTLEENFVVDLDGRHKLRGIVDRTDQDKDGIYHIKDYKTNKNAKYMDHEQLRAYGLYLLNKFPDVEIFRGSYIMLRFGTLHIDYDFNLEDVEKARQDLICSADKIMEEEKWSPKPTKLCDWCDFKEKCFNTWA